jgi:tricorn protease
VTAPAFGIFDRDKGEWIAENIGVDPDIEVDARPDLVVQGKDPVLDKGLEVLMKQLPKDPKRWPEPAFPKIGKGGN